jgi:FKBP-type peptidyl-prolyl cis-trans isomerase FklB
MVYAEEAKTLSSPKGKLNYAIGVEIARNYKSRGIDIDLDMVTRGMKDGVSGEKLLLSEKELRNILISVQSDLRRKQSAAKRSPGTGFVGAGDDSKKPEIQDTSVAKPL